MNLTSTFISYVREDSKWYSCFLWSQTWPFGEPSMRSKVPWSSGNNLKFDDDILLSSQDKADYAKRSHIRDLTLRYNSLCSDFKNCDLPSPSSTLVFLGVSLIDLLGNDNTFLYMWIEKFYKGLSSFTVSVNLKVLRCVQYTYVYV